MRESCCVADQFCTAAANYSWSRATTKAVCYRCGLPVCTMCSTRRQYLRRGRVRLCNDCQVELDGHDRTVMRRLHRLAGY